ncbi:hypothetical protein Glove_219g90 [Diversispora epigaea]|uniref:Reverse transcriptase domain-containing protein n=1 Tax=Diversispora epigaea TaxID=1348612 RepID=A0A397IFX9_9GLOM|nr:hypothetical protein Glove_219g90 [Diversispora epigaea]
MTQDNLHLAQERQKKDITFELGDKVLLFARNIIISPTAYKLKLPYNLKIHSVFHMLLLKLYNENPDDFDKPKPPPPEIIKENEELEYEVRYPLYNATWEPVKNLINVKERIAEFEKVINEDVNFLRRGECNNSTYIPYGPPRRMNNLPDTYTKQSYGRYTTMPIKSMERLKISMKFINVLEDIMKQRTAWGITKYGDTDSYKTMGHLQSHISSLAYMDDTVWIANSKEQMQKLIKVAKSFFDLILIILSQGQISFDDMYIVNAAKLDLLILNSKNTRKENAIDFVNSKLMSHKARSSVRYLGVWISTDGRKEEQKKILIEKVIKSTNILRCKQLTDKQLRYIINHVIFSQIEYLLMNIILNESVINKINVNIKGCFKNTVRFVLSLPNSILYLHWGYRLFNIENRQLQLHGIEFMNRLNMNNRCGITTKIRLQDLQNKM